METEQRTVVVWERKKGAQLGLAERGAIQSLRGQGVSLRQIAEQIRCSPTTVLNEHGRGTPEQAGTRGPSPGYGAELGRRTYQAHRQRCRKRPCVLKAARFLEWMKERVRRHKWSFVACVGYARRQGLFPEERIPCAKSLSFPAKR